MSKDKATGWPYRHNRAGDSRRNTAGYRLTQNQLTSDLTCAVVLRRRSLVGANPARQLLLQPVAIEEVVEATKRLKPSM
ncbi:MAG: hypothetical protein ACXW1U_13985 [Methylobacter sp.]